MENEILKQAIKASGINVEIKFINKALSKKRLIAFIDEMLKDRKQKTEHNNLSILKSIIEDRDIKKINLKLNFNQDGKA